MRQPARGVNQGLAKLTDEKIREIRKLRLEGIKLKDLARSYGVHVSTIGRIAKNEIWRHVR